MNLPSISVIIPTYQREGPLQDSIEDVLAQNYDADKFEVLVIDQTQTHTPKIQAYLEAVTAAGKIHWHRLPWASLPGARNFGVRQATGDIVLFLDDDVRLEPNYLRTHAHNYADPEIGAVAGRVFDAMKLADAVRQKKAQADQPYEIDFLPPEAMDPGIAWYHIDLVHTTQPQQVISARGCNMSYRRDIFTKHGVWFDERFRGNAVREESDFCLRLRRTGYKVWYDPAAHLIHLGEQTGGCHDVGTRSLKYQVTFYHNHFLMALKNLTLNEQLRLYAKLFDCHVLGNPPCYKSGSPAKIAVRGVFYSLGFFDALNSVIKSAWDDGQIYTRQDASSV
ncbi:MAG: hormogonium polysaccharide biosynthesis glycosyltransferase HpsN [Cyanobacteria bacterium P01_H01_bin.15]